MKIFGKSTSDFTDLSVLLFLIALSLLLTTIIGDIGFQGDDWWVLAYPYWNGYFDALWLYAVDSLRPVEGFYWISLFKLFEFNRIYYQFCSILLSSMGCFLMGMCLKRAFPHKPSLWITAIFICWSLPVLSPLTYLIHTDNSRLAIVFFWCSVLLFQWWAKNSISFKRLIFALALYLIACTTYETASFLIFAVPFFTLPVHLRTRGTDGSLNHFFWKSVAATTLGFGLFILIRFSLFSGGAVGHRSIFPNLLLIPKYISGFLIYLRVPFLEITEISGMSAILALVAVIGMITILYFNGSGSSKEKPLWYESPFYVLGLGGLVFALGIVPYMMAGYTAEIGFTSQSRIYSSASFGAAIFLAGFSTLSSKRIGRVIGTAFVVSFVFVNVAFWSNLRFDWQNAALLRTQLCTSLLNNVPGVRSGSTFLFWDLQSYISNRAVVFQGVDGLRQYIKMLYNDRSLDAYFLYSRQEGFDSSQGRRASVSTKGIVARGGSEREPIPLEQLIIVKKIENSLEVVNTLTKEDGLAELNWDGVDRILTNRALISSVSSGRKTFCGE